MTANKPITTASNYVCSSAMTSCSADPSGYRIAGGQLRPYLCGLRSTVSVYEFVPSHKTKTRGNALNTRVGTLIVATIYLQLIQNRYMFRSFTVLHCSHQHCVQPVASEVEVVGYL